MNKVIYTINYATPIGDMLLAGNHDGLMGAWFHEQKYFLNKVDGCLVEDGTQPILNQAVKWLDAYFAGQQPQITDLKLAAIGTDFYRDVWELLCKIPYGRTVNYGKLAEIMAKKRGLERMSAQAVGRAVGKNPLAIIVPCHRVVGKNGSLTGYAGGLEKKIALLKLEGVNLDNFYRPVKGTAL